VNQGRKASGLNASRHQDGWAALLKQKNLPMAGFSVFEARKY
jgi:hypothetical protein